MNISSMLFRYINWFWPGTISKAKGASCLLCDGRHIQRNSDNYIHIGSGASLYKCTFIIKGKNNIVTIGKNCTFNNTTFWISGDNNAITIGDNTTVGHNCEFATLEGTAIVVGEDCMFSHDIRLRTSDSHSIINNEGVRINNAKSISVGNHCWIGMQVLILKGSQVQDNSIVAARALVSKQFDEGCAIIAGMPATIIRTNINWDRKRL